MKAYTLMSVILWPSTFTQLLLFQYLNSIVSRDRLTQTQISKTRTRVSADLWSYHHSRIIREFTWRINLEPNLSNHWTHNRLMLILIDRFLAFFEFNDRKKLHWGNDDDVISTIYSNRMAFTGFSQLTSFLRLLITACYTWVHLNQSCVTRRNTSKSSTLHQYYEAWLFQ